MGLQEIIISDFADQLNVADYAAMLPEIKKRVQRFENCATAKVYTAKREISGFLHWQIVLLDSSDKRIILLGAVQRGIDQPVEFHS